MRGLSLTQPWATLVALGAKRIETRSWSTSYRGELLIQAAKTFPPYCREFCLEEPFLTVLKAAGYVSWRDLPTGLVLAVANLTGVAKTEEWTAMSQGLLQHEIAFGDYSRGRFGFALAEVRALPTPIPAAHVASDGTTKPGGALGLWSVPQVVVDLVAGQGLL